MREIISSNGMKLLGLAVIVFIVAQVSLMPILYQVSYLMVAMVVLAFIWTRTMLWNLVITRETRADHCQVGETVEETFTVTNRSFLNKPWVEVIDYSDLPDHHIGRVLNLPPGKRKRWRVKTTCYRRGKYSLGPATVSVGDPLGLFRFGRLVSGSTEITVFPATVDLAGLTLPVGEWQGGNEMQYRPNAVTPNVASVRDYRPGDSFNHISWNHTARLQKLIVKEFEYDPTPDHWILLDMDEKVHLVHPDADPIPGSTVEAGLVQSTEEYAVTVAASLARHFLTLKRPVGLVSWAQQHVRIPADRGGRQMMKILDDLALMGAQGKAPLIEMIAGESRLFTRSSTLIIITPSTDDAWAYSLRHVTQRGVRVVAVLIEPSTFGGEASALTTVGALAASGVPSFLVKRNASIAEGLARSSYRGRRVR